MFMDLGLVALRLCFRHSMIFPDVFERFQELSITYNENEIEDVSCLHYV